MKHIYTSLRILAICAVLGGISFHLSRTITVSRLASAQVKAVPFTLELRHYRFDEDPNGQHFQTSVIARRSDGSTAQIRPVGPAAFGWTLRRVVYMDGRALTISDLLASRISGQTPEHELASLKAKLSNIQPDCGVKRSQILEHSSVMGVPVVFFATSTPEGRLVIGQAPSLGCEVLRFWHEKNQPDGSLTRVSEVRAEKLVWGEPDPSLFDGKPEYTETRPSQMQERYYEKAGIPVDGATFREHP
jgi:hypothetical protein